MSNIYLELELSLDPPITDAVVLTNELNAKIAHWQKLTQYSADYQKKINLAQQYLRQGLFNLPAQAEEARTQQLLNLQETAAKLLSTANDTSFVKEYLQRNFSAFQKNTIETALLEIRSHKPSISSLPQPTTESQKPSDVNIAFVMMQKILAAHWKKVVVLGGVLFALYLFVHIFSFMGSMMPSISIGGSGPDTVRYPNRDYSKAKWQKMDQAVEPLFGKNKNHFVAVGNNYRICYYNDGKWNAIDMPATRINHIESGVFITDNNEIGIVDPKSLRFVKLPENFSRADKILEMEKGVYYVGNHYQPNIGVIFSGGKVQELNDDKRLFIWNGNTNCGSIFGLYPMQTYKNGAALGWNCRDNTLAKYSTSGGWVKYLETTRHGNVAALWAIDDKNFVLVGDGITLFKNGEESHLSVHVPEFSPNRPFRTDECIAVWGTSIDHFWVMDVFGNIIQWKTGEFTKAVSGPSSYRHCWISPDGAVFHFVLDGLWRLD